MQAPGGPGAAGALPRGVPPAAVLRPLTLPELITLRWAQVTDMPASKVVEAIEHAVYVVAQSIMTGTAERIRLQRACRLRGHHFAGQGFRYSVPSRANSNQLYVKELDRIVRNLVLRCGSSLTRVAYDRC